MGKEVEMKALIFPDVSHLMFYLLTLPINYVFLLRSFDNAQNNRPQAGRNLKKSHFIVHIHISSKFLSNVKSFLSHNFFEYVFVFFLILPNFFFF